MTPLTLAALGWLLAAITMASLWAWQQFPAGNRILLATIAPESDMLSAGRGSCPGSVRLDAGWTALVAGQASAGRDPSEHRDELLAVWSEVDRLPDRQRQILYLRYRADLSFEDIGSVLAIDASSARASASRGIAALRDRLAEEED